MEKGKVEINKSNDAFEDFDFQQYIILLWENKLAIFMIALLGFATSIFVALARKNIWEGQFQIVLQKSDSSKGNASGIDRLSSRVRNLISVSKNTLNTEVAILQSPSVLNPIFKYVKDEKIRSDSSAKDLRFRKWKENQLKIELKPGTKILNVSYYDSNKEAIIPVLNKISDKYQKYSSIDREKNINKTIIFLENQIDIYKSRSLDSLKDLQNYAREYDLSPIQENKIKESFTFLDIDKKRVRAKNNIKTIQYTLNKLKELKPEESNQLLFIASQIPSIKQTTLPKIIEQINDLDKELLYDRSIYTPRDTVIIKKIKIKNNLLELLRNQSIDYLIVNRKMEEAILKQSERPKGVIVNFKQLLRNAYRDENTLTELENSKRLLALEQSKKSDPWDLITEPTVLDTSLGYGKKKIVMLGTFTSIIFTIFFILFKQKINNIFYTEKQYISSINFPLLKSLNNNPNDWFDQLDFLLNDLIISDKDDKLCFIIIGNFGKDLLNSFSEVIAKTINNDNYLIASSLKDANKYKKKILVTANGAINKNNLIDFLKMINLQDQDPLGWIYIDKYNFEKIL